MRKAREVHLKRRAVVPFRTKTADEVSWKPRVSWLIVLRRTDGARDVRSFSGSYQEAVIARNGYLHGSLYASAWLVEEREKHIYKRAS